MNREIKFRGKSKELNKWFYGSLVNTIEFADFILEDAGFENRVQVIHETVGQFTGLKDTKLIDVFEGDVVSLYKKGSNYSRHYQGVVVWNIQQAGYMIRCDKYLIEILSLAMEGDGEVTILSSLEIIGNIHDNPELIKPQ